VCDVFVRSSYPRLCDPSSDVSKKLFKELDTVNSTVSEIELLSMHLFLIVVCGMAEAHVPLTGFFETQAFAMQLYNKCDQLVSTLNGKMTLAYVRPPRPGRGPRTLAYFGGTRTHGC